MDHVAKSATALPAGGLVTSPTAPATRRLLSNYAYIISRSHRPLLWRGPVGGVSGRPVCDAALDKNPINCEAGHHRNGHY